MRPAHILWKELNTDRYRCDVCGYKTHNRAMFSRHLKSSRHFLMTMFREECPYDLKVLTLSFLPVWKIIQAPKVIARNALKLAWPRPARYDHLPRVVLPDLISSAGQVISPPAQTAGGAAWIIDTARNQFYATS